MTTSPSELLTAAQSVCAISKDEAMFRAVLARQDPAGVVVADSVQLAFNGTAVRVHPISHDRAKEHGAFATRNGRPRKPRQDAPDAVGVKAEPPRGRRRRALTPIP